MKICGIYKITNQLNNKCYIGQSVHIYKRWTDHKTSAKNENTPLYLAMRKYGIENFSFEIIEECDPSQLNEKEIYWIKYQNSYYKGYNQTIGGEGNIKEDTELVLNIKKELKETEETQKNIAKKYGVSEEMVQGINTGRYWQLENTQYPLRESKFNPQKPAKIQTCIDCGIKISKNSIRCVSCENKHRIKEKPISRNELKELIRKESFLKIGKKFNMSDNGIRKWCDFYNLPRTKKEINSYSDEEWEKI